ncbi:MAG TPA: hypothetical protein VH115_04080 [Solirubrobacteraceae bacterium]|nr:hypothetical protein [Solirubrobacteraceae bacterium]
MSAARNRALLTALTATTLLVVIAARAAGVAGAAGAADAAARADTSNATAARAHARARTVNGFATDARPSVVRYGADTVISGTLVGSTGTPVPGELLELQRARQPSTRFLDIAHTTTNAHGGYRFPAIRVEGDARFRVADEGRGGRTGPVVAVALEPPPAYPAAARVLAAERYLALRAGVGAFAVVDSRGDLSGANIRRRFHSASIVKAMLLVAYMRMLDAQHRSLDSAGTSLLYPMIHSSDNAAASAVLGIVGQAALDRVAADAHMDDFRPSAGWWAFTEVSAADLARFFSVFDSLVPPRFDGYARSLLGGIEPSQSWGIPAVARPEFAVYFKGGWLPESEGLVNQTARLERPGISFSLAVLTQDNPSTASQPPHTKAGEAMQYGEQTIAGVTERLLGRAY